MRVLVGHLANMERYYLFFFFRSLRNWTLSFTEGGLGERKTVKSEGPSWEMDWVESARLNWFTNDQQHAKAGSSKPSKQARQAFGREHSWPLSSAEKKERSTGGHNNGSKSKGKGGLNGNHNLQWPAFPVGHSLHKDPPSKIPAERPGENWSNSIKLPPSTSGSMHQLPPLRPVNSSTMSTPRDTSRPNSARREKQDRQQPHPTANQDKVYLNSKALRMKQHDNTARKASYDDMETVSTLSVHSLDFALPEVSPARKSKKKQSNVPFGSSPGKNEKKKKPSKRKHRSAMQGDEISVVGTPLKDHTASDTDNMSLKTADSDVRWKSEEPDSPRKVGIMSPKSGRISMPGELSPKNCPHQPIIVLLNWFAADQQPRFKDPKTVFLITCRCLVVGFGCWAVPNSFDLDVSLGIFVAFLVVLVALDACLVILNIVSKPAPPRLSSLHSTGIDSTFIEIPLDTCATGGTSTDAAQTKRITLSIAALQGFVSSSQGKSILKPAVPFISRHTEV